MQTTPDTPLPRWRTPVFLGVLSLLTTALYAAVFQHQILYWDDYDYIVVNPHVQDFSWENLLAAFQFYQANWTPLTWVSHMFGVAWFGQEGSGHHALNLLFHCLNSLLVFFVAHALIRAACAEKFGANFIWWAAAASALLFAIHPQHVEVVAWIAARKDVLSSFFLLLTLYSYLRYAQSEARATGLWYGAALLSFALALMAKPSVMALPLWLLLIDFYPLQRQQRCTWGKILLDKAPFLLLSAGVALLALLGQSNDGAVTDWATFSLQERVLNASAATLGYLQKFAFPTFFSPLYPLSKDLSIWPLFGIIAITAACIFAWLRRQPVYLIAWLGYCVAIFPIIGLVQFGPHASADRFAYWTLLPFYLLAGFGFAYLWQLDSNNLKRFLPKLGIVCFLLLSVLVTHQQVMVWRNDLTLWHYTVSAYPNSSAAQKGMGNAWLRAGQPQRAIMHYQLALQAAEQEGMVFEPVSLYYGLGVALMELEQTEQAKAVFQEVLKIDPSHASAQQALQELSQ